MTNAKKFYESYGLIIILAGALLLRLVNLNQSFWLDEAAQVMESSRPLSQQLDIKADFHPPLFHLILFSWMYLGHSEIIIRILPVLLAIGSIWLLYLLTVKFTGKGTALLASLFLAVSPYHIWYSQEVRPYMLFVFFSLLSTLMLVRRRWVLYSLTSAASLYSLYFAPFLLLSHTIYGFYYDRKNIKKIISALLGATLLFVPWIPSFINQIKTGTGGQLEGWTNVVSVGPLKVIPLTLAKFILGRGTFTNKMQYAGLLLPAGAVFLSSLFRIKTQVKGKKMLLLFFIPIIAGTVVSFIIPVAAPQRYINMLPLFCIVIALGSESLSRNIKILSITIILSSSLLGIIHYYTDVNVQREQWKQAINEIETTAPQKSTALFLFPDPFAPYNWYKTGKIDAFGITPGFHYSETYLSQLNTYLESRHRIYLFQYLTGLTDPKEQTRHYLATHGFSEVSILNYPGVGFIYVFNRNQYAYSY